MPITRYQIRNEHSLADPELYRAADKDDPEALLEGVAMAGLVGLLRQLGDLSEFAAQIFHDLHEEVMVTAARGHGLVARVQQLEVEVPSLERTFLSQTHHLSFFSNGGIDWHPNLQSKHNLISHGDLPRFVMDSYEDCRGPPRLILLDKFDVAGAGACLKRYTDPSFFKMESASSGLATVEVSKEKKNRKIKKKGTRLRNGEISDVAPTHAKLHQLLLEERIEDVCSDPAHLVKMKKRQLDGSAVEAKTGKSYMEKLLESPSVNHKMVCETSAYPHPVRLVSDDTSELGIKILEISSIRPEKRSLGNEMTRSWTNEKESELKPSSEMCRETDGDLVMVHEQVSVCTDEVSLNHHKAPEERELAVDEQKKTESFLDGYHSDDVTSDVDNYLDALATMESELETDYNYRPKSSFLHILKLTDSDNKEDQLQARFSYSQSFGDSSTSDEIASFKQYINEEHAELQARLSDSQSGTSFTSDENSSVKRDRIEDYSEQAKFSDFQYFQDSSSDVNSCFTKDISCFSYTDSLSTVIENIQSEPTLHQSIKYSKSEIEDINQLPQIVETQKTDCCEFLMHDDGTHDAEEEISGVREVFSGSYLMNSGHKLLYSDLGATLSMKLPTGTQTEEAPSGPVELQLRLADEDTKYKVESADAIPDVLSSMNADASPAVSFEKYPLNNLNDGDQCVTYNPILKISNDLELASDECCNHSEIKAFQSESPNENYSEILFSREIGTEGEHSICSFMEEVVDLHASTTLPLDSLVSKAVDDTVATQLNAEDLSSVVKTSSVCSFTRKQCSDLINSSSQDELDSARIEVKCYDWQSEFEQISKMEHGDEVSRSTCNVDADEDDSQLKDSSSTDYRGQDCHVPVDDVVYTEIQSEEQAVSADTSEKDLSVATCLASNMISSASRDLSNLQEPIPGSSCSHEIKMEPNEVESTKIYVDSHAEKMEYQLEPSSDFNMTSPMRNPTSLEESYSTFIDPHDKQMEVIKAVARESFTDLETMKVKHQSDTACADVQLNLHGSVPCDDSEICNSIKDSSTKEQTKCIASVKDVKIVPVFSKLDTHESESISIWQKKLLPNGKDGLSSTSYNQLESGTHLEQFLQSQVGQQDAGILLKDVKNSSSKKLQSEEMQISNHLEEERSSHAASNSAHEIHLDQPTSSESLSQSAGQEVNHTKHVINKPLSLRPERFTKGSEINFEEMPPMPPLPPMQWRNGKFQLASLASHKEVIEVSQNSFQSIQLIKSNEKAQYGLPTPGRETLQYQNPFLPVMAVESDKLQHTSGFSVGGHPVAIPLQLPIMLNEANGQYNYLVLDRSQIPTPILTLPVPLVSTSKPPHGHIVASEGETIKNSNPSPPMQPLEHANSGHDPISPQELCQPPSQLMTEPSLEVKTLQQSPSNLEQGDSSISSMSPLSTEYMQPPNHNKQPSESEMASTLDTSALASDFESEKLDERPKNNLPRPRSPLIDAVAIPDKSKLRKVAERIRPRIAPKVEERDSFLEQIRQKSFNLKPPSPLQTRYHYQAPKTNLKVAAILEKANSIRQALAGSDEDDDMDSWSDS